jgi:hypothetical protein
MFAGRQYEQGWPNENAFGRQNSGCKLQGSTVHSVETRRSGKMRRVNNRYEGR